MKDLSEDLHTVIRFTWADRSFLFRFEAFSEVEIALEEVFSPAAASVILYESAKRCGMRSCKRILEKVKRKEEVLRQLSELKNEENWGNLIFRDVDVENGTGKIIVTNSFETMERRGDRPICHFFRGFFAGFFTCLSEKVVKVTEEKCVGKGDEYCEFDLLPLETVRAR